MELILPPGDALSGVLAERGRTSLLGAVGKSGTASATNPRACTSRIITRIVSYDGAPAIRDILLVSDLNDGIDFERTLVQSRTLVSFDFNVAQIDRGTLGTTAAKGELIERLNRDWG